MTEISVYTLDQEKVQRATKLIHDLQNCIYNDCPTTLPYDLNTVDYMEIIMIMLYRLLHNQFNLDTPETYYCNCGYVIVKQTRLWTFFYHNKASVFQLT